MNRSIARFAFAAALALTAFGCAVLRPFVEETWAPYEPGPDSPWRIQEGRWQSSDEGRWLCDNAQWTYGCMTRPLENFSDQTIRARIQILQDYSYYTPSWAGFAVRCPDALVQGGVQGGYQVMLNADSTVELYLFGQDTITTAPMGCDPHDAPVELKAEARGDHIRVWVNGQLRIDARNNQYPTGSVALSNFSNKATFEDIIIEGTEVPPAPFPVRECAAPDHPAPPAPIPYTPLPRIALTQNEDGHGRFVVAETGSDFFPQGYDYTESGHWGWHGALNLGIYDPAAVEAMFVEMEELGANAIRLWVWGENHEGEGFDGPRTGRGMSPAYLANFADFLRRAANHGIYTVALLDRLPYNAGYAAVAHKAGAGTDPNIAGWTSSFLNPGPIAAKAAAAADFVRGLGEIDPELLNGVLCWEIENEAFALKCDAPFVYDNVTVRPANGQTYDMSDPASRRACWDESSAHWANKVARAIKDAHPAALVCVGMFPCNALGEQPDSGLDQPGDQRVPMRPKAIVGEGTGLDTLDIHYYAWGGDPAIYPKPLEWPDLLASGRTMFLGEFGPAKPDDIETAAEKALKIRAQAYSMGFQGSAAFIWGPCNDSTGIWCLSEDDLKRKLAPVPIPMEP